MILRVSKATVFALVHLSKKTSDEVVDALSIAALNFYKASIEKHAKNPRQASFSKQQTILNLPSYAKLKFYTNSYYMDEDYCDSIVLVELPLVKGSLNVDVETRARSAVLKSIEEQLLNVQEDSDEV